MNKMRELLTLEGLTKEEFLENYALESCVPGICKNPNCDFVSFNEPDCKDGWCEECQDNTVVSGLILMGVI